MEELFYLFVFTFLVLVLVLDNSTLLESTALSIWTSIFEPFLKMIAEASSVVSDDHIMQIVIDFDPKKGCL